MTKLRPPLSFESALITIKDLVGWAEMAKLAGQSVRTVEEWADHDVPRHCPLPTALAFDLAYQRAGGAGAPIADMHRQLLDQASAQAIACQREMGQRTCTVIREVAQAEEALVLYSIDPTPTSRATALREVVEGMAALSATLPGLVPEPPP